MRTLCALLYLFFLLSCGTNKTSEPQEVNLDDRDQKMSYSYGVEIAQRARNEGVVLDPAVVAAAITDMNSDSAKLTSAEAKEFINEYVSSKALEEGKKFLAENREKEGVVELPSGLQYEVIQEGTGESPGPTNTVTTHYHGTLIDGTVFDSSVERGEPVQFPVNGVIQGWQEALQLMKVGSKWKLFVPPNLAYGPRRVSREIGPNSTLIFEVELLSVDN